MNMFRVALDWIARRYGYVTLAEMNDAVAIAQIHAAEEQGPRHDASDEQSPLVKGKFNYFVSYSHGRGHGAIDIHMDRPITSWNDIARVTKLIDATVSTRHRWETQNIVILNWRQYDLEPTDGSREDIPSENMSAGPGLRLVANGDIRFQGDA